MANLFEPSLKELFKLVDSQVSLLKEKAGRKVDVSTLEVYSTASDQLPSDSSSWVVSGIQST